MPLSCVCVSVCHSPVLYCDGATELVSVPSELQVWLCQTLLYSFISNHQITQSQITNRLIVSVAIYTRNGLTFTVTQPEDDSPAYGCAGLYIQGRSGLPARRAASRGCQRWQGLRHSRQGHTRVADGRIQPAQIKTAKRIYRITQITPNDSPMTRVF